MVKPLQPEVTATTDEHKLDSEEEPDSLHRVSTRYSQHTLYGSMSESSIELERQRTRTTIASRAEQSSLYNHSVMISTGGDDQMPSGIEFEKDDPELVTWDSVDDPKDPRNWSTRRKVMITAFASTQSLIPTYASSVVAPVVPNILADFNNSNQTVGSLMVSIMVMMWGISSMFWAPISEVIGRRRVMLISGAFNLAFNIGCATAPNTQSMLVFRALGGFFNGVPISMGAGAIADIYNDKDRQWPLAIWDLAPCCGPAIAPIVGGWIAQTTSWRWVFWSVVIFQGATLLTMLVFYEETYPQVLLNRKRDQLIKITQNKNLHTIWDLNRIPWSKQVKLAALRPCFFLILNPIITLLSVYLAFTYGFMYLILVDFPALWKEIYHFSPGIGGLMYIGYAVGMLIGVFFWTAAINWWFDKQHAHGKGKLEERLFWLPFSTVILAAGMFWYGWSAEARLPWPMPVVGIGIFAFALFCVFQAVQSYIVSLNSRLAGSIMASSVLFRSFLAGTFPLFGKGMYNHLGYGWSSTVVALLALVLGVPWPIGIYIYGPKLRKWVDQNITIE